MLYVVYGDSCQSLHRMLVCSLDMLRIFKKLLNFMSRRRIRKEVVALNMSYELCKEL